MNKFAPKGDFVIGVGGKRGYLGRTGIRKEESYHESPRRCKYAQSRERSERPDGEAHRVECLKQR